VNITQATLEKNTVKRVCKNAFYARTHVTHARTHKDAQNTNLHTLVFTTIFPV